VLGRVVIHPQVTVNATLFYRQQRYEVHFDVIYLTDEKNFSTVFDGCCGSNLVLPGEPIRYRASVSYRFCIRLNRVPLRLQLFFCLLPVVVACGVGCRPAPKDPSIEKLSWEQIVDQARGRTVNLAMWQGNSRPNATPATAF